MAREAEGGHIKVISDQLSNVLPSEMRSRVRGVRSMV